MPKEPKGFIGQSVDDFFEEQGMLPECQAGAIKEILAEQVQQAMERENISKSEMARRMKTSRPALDRLLDPANSSVTLHTMQRAAAAVGKRLSLSLQ